MRPPQQTPEARPSGLTRSHVIGYALAGAACLAYGASLILAKQVVEDTPPLLGATLGMSFGLVVLAVISAPDVPATRDAARRGVGRIGAAWPRGWLTLSPRRFKRSVVVSRPILAMNP